MEIVATSLGDQIEQALREEILAGKLQPGQRLSITGLAKRWSVSSMPVRDAVRRLETAGFVTVSPRRGVFVAKYDMQRFKNILDIRMALECLAIELSIEHIPEAEIDAGIATYEQARANLRSSGGFKNLAVQDNLVHDLIFKYCRNPELTEIMKGLRNLIHWGHQTASTSRPDALERALPEHLEIMVALKNRNLEAAQNAMRAHLQSTIDRTLEIWSVHTRKNT